jgi:hypothetical protein
MRTTDPMQISCRAVLKKNQKTFHRSVLAKNVLQIARLFPKMRMAVVRNGLRRRQQPPRRQHELGS